jgi:GTP-binding protein
VIDISGFEGRDPFNDFTILRNEIKAYRRDVLEKPFLVALNKIDVEGAKEQIELFRAQYPFDPSTIFEISAMEDIGLAPLVESMRRLAHGEAKKF